VASHRSSGEGIRVLWVPPTIRYIGVTNINAHDERS